MAWTDMCKIQLYRTMNVKIAMGALKIDPPPDLFYSSAIVRYDTTGKEANHVS